MNALKLYAIFFSFLFLYSCASFKAKNLNEYLAKNPSIAVARTSVNVNGAPLLDRINLKAVLINDLVSDTGKPEDSENTIVLEEDPTEGVDIMTIDEYGLSSFYQRALLQSLNDFEACSVQLAFPCDIYSLKESEEIFEICKNSTGRPRYAPEPRYTSCITDTQPGLILFSRLSAKMDTDIMSSRPGALATLLIPYSTTIVDIAEIAGLTERDYKSVDSRSHFEIALVHLKSGQILYYRYAFLPESPFNSETINKFVHMTADSIPRSRSRGAE
jgi:hypothetical protein